MKQNSRLISFDALPLSARLASKRAKAFALNPRCRLRTSDWPVVRGFEGRCKYWMAEKTPTTPIINIRSPDWGYTHLIRDAKEVSPNTLAAVLFCTSVLDYQGTRIQEDCCLGEFQTYRRTWIFLPLSQEFVFCTVYTSHRAMQELVYRSK